MMQSGFKLFDWDETTGKAEFYRQGILILSLTLPSYEEAQSIYNALDHCYNKGVEDGLLWIAEAVTEKRKQFN